VRLRSVQESDLPSFVEWLGDHEMTRWLAEMGSPPTLEEEYEWYERRRADPDSVMWAIESLDGGLAGTVELRLRPERKRAEVGIAIQDKRQWNKGFGTEAMQLVAGYAFDDLGLNRLELTTDEANARAIRCYEKVGFVREGLLRQHRIVGGKADNTVIMGLLRDEWRRE